MQVAGWTVAIGQWIAISQPKTMKKRILLVGEGPEELKSLQEAAVEAQDDWEIVAAPAKDVALELAGLEHFDVVIANTPTGSDGLRLLDEFAKAHPSLIRFLLSNTLDDGEFMECIWKTHQYVARPWKPEILKERIERALAADSWLANDKLKARVAQMRTFPTLPSVYFEVLRALESPTASAETIGELISRDLAITAKVIQTVNSAVFGLARTITSANEAVFILGYEIVKGLVLSVHAFGQLDHVKPLYFTTGKVWSHSLAVARLARRVAERESPDRNVADAAFTAGLFHDLGKLLLASNFSTEYDGAHSLALKRNIPLHEVETELFGATHAEIAAYLLALWGFPIPIVEAVAFHHAPLRASNESFSALTAVHVANAFLHEQRTEKDQLVRSNIDTAYIEKIGLQDRIEVWRECVAGNVAPARPAAKPAARPAAEAKPAAPPPTPRRAATPTASAPAPAPRKRVSPRVAAIASFAAVLVIGLIWFATRGGKEADGGRSVPVSAREGDPTSGETAAAPGESVPAAGEQPSQASVKPDGSAPTTPADPLSTLRLEGIFFRSIRPAAVLNGKTVFKGDIIAGARVIAIDRQSVIVEFGGQQKTLRLTQK